MVLYVHLTSLPPQVLRRMHFLEHGTARGSSEERVLSLSTVDTFVGRVHGGEESGRATLPFRGYFQGRHAPKELEGGSDDTP